MQFASWSETFFRKFLILFKCIYYTCFQYQNNSEHLEIIKPWRMNYLLTGWNRKIHSKKSIAGKKCTFSNKKYLLGHWAKCTILNAIHSVDCKWCFGSVRYPEDGYQISPWFLGLYSYDRQCNGFYQNGDTYQIDICPRFDKKQGWPMSWWFTTIY